MNNDDDDDNDNNNKNNYYNYDDVTSNTVKQNKRYDNDDNYNDIDDDSNYYRKDSYKNKETNSNDKIIGRGDGSLTSLKVKKWEINLNSAYISWNWPCVSLKLTYSGIKTFYLSS